MKKNSEVGAHKRRTWNRRFFEMYMTETGAESRDSLQIFGHDVQTLQRQMHPTQETEGTSYHPRYWGWGVGGGGGERQSLACGWGL